MKPKNIPRVVITALFGLFVAGLVSPAIAFDNLEYVSQVVELKDGSTLYIFKDGKMGMESSRGQIVYMRPGAVMEAKDGRKIVMKGNEVWRVEELKNKHFR